MTEPVAKPRRRWKFLRIAAGVALLLSLAGLWYITTDSFQQYVRRRLIAEVERITGGRAEIGSFHVIPFRMQVEVRDITVHGTEDATEVPLAHADSLVAHLKVISFLRAQFGFHSVDLQHPVVNIAIAKDGTTNIPGTRITQSVSPAARVEQLFALSIDHLAMRNGDLFWGDHRFPLDLTVQDANVQADYSFLRGRYETYVAIGKVDTALEDLRPFSWMATMRVSMGTTFAEIESLEWNSGKSSVKASGRISDFRDPHLEGSYEARFNLTDAAAIARRNEIREGTAEFKGTGQWSLNSFSTSGSAVLRDVGWQNEDFAIRKVGASSDYSVDDQKIRLTKLQGKALEGVISGDALVENWLRSIPMPVANKNKREELPEISAARPLPKKGEKSKPVGVQAGAVHLRLRDLSLSAAIAGFDTPAHPMSHFHPSGATGGTAEMAWKGDVKNAEVAFDLSVSPPAQNVAQELPVTAKALGKYYLASDALELTQFNLATPASRMRASGSMSPTSAMRVEVSTSNLEEWRPLVTALGGPTNVPFRVDGAAAFNGAVGGTLTAPTIVGTLVADDFEFTLPATSHAAEKQVHWDSLAASIQFSAREISLRGGTLRRGDTSASFDITAGLQKGKLTDDSPIAGQINLHRVDVASTEALAGFAYPVTGMADVSLQIQGTRANPAAQGHIHAVNASAYGEEVARLDADLHLDANEVGLSNIQLTHQDATLTGSAAYERESRGLRLELEGTNFDLWRVSQIQMQPLPIEGRADFTLQASGTADQPQIKAHVEMRDLTFDHEYSGGLVVDIDTKDGALQLNAKSAFTRGSVVVDGTVGMHGDYPARMTAHMEHLDADALWLAYLGGELTGHSASSGSVTMEGPLRYPRRWTLDGRVTDLAIELETVKLHNQDPVSFTFDHQTIHIAPTHLVGDGTDVTGHGSIQFTGPQALDLIADGHADLRLLGGFDPNLTASGSMTLHMNLGGTLDNPLPQGTAQIQNASANYAGLPSGLSEVNGALTVTRDRIHIEQLTARTGGGTVDLSGDGTHYNGQYSFNVQAVANDVRLRYPPGVSSTATARLRWSGTRSSSTVSGEVMVTKLAVTPGFDFGSYLERSRQSAGITPATSPLNNIKLDVAVHTAPELQMKTAVARLSGDADLKVRGSIARPSVLGRADILEGDATFNGIKFRLEHGDVTFANPVAIEPQVNLQATTHVRNYDLDIQVTGTTDRLNVNYRSEPPLPKSDIIALLALGRTTEESETLQQQPGQAMFTDEATNLIINQAINSTVSSRMQKLFGVSRIKIDPQGLTTETNPTARGPQVTIEQQFANNLSLTYSTNVSQSSEQIIEGEYYIKRNISVVGTRDQNGVVSFDVRVRRQQK